MTALPDPVFTQQRIVSSDHVDANGHVNNVVFVQWMQDVATAHAHAVGGTEATRAVGATWVVRAHHVEYLRPAHAGDRIVALTWVADLGRARSARQYLFRREADGIDLVRGETDWVLVNADTGRPMAIPEAIASCFRVVPGKEAP